jgi:predicted membrane protein
VANIEECGQDNSGCHQSQQELLLTMDKVSSSYLMLYIYVEIFFFLYLYFYFFMLGFKGKPEKERENQGRCLAWRVSCIRVFYFYFYFFSFTFIILLYFISIYCMYWVQHARDRGRGRCQEPCECLAPVKTQKPKLTVVNDTCRSSAVSSLCFDGCFDHAHARFF